MTNRLSKESSPYLLQHAENPVDWYPWGQDALALAREQDKPMLLSIGYAACHWCHVMAHESFEDPEIAAIMNEHFINIKVDREERPDIDRIYMSAVVAMTRQGGWPMTVALTPDGEPFFGGTYFPPVARHGLPSFRQILGSLADAWQNRRDEIQDSASRLVDHLAETATLDSQHSGLDDAILDKAVTVIKSSFDQRSGGFGQAPKFPQPMTIEFLIRYHQLTGDSQALHMAEFTLEKMALGGIYDQLTGGFARYSTDDLWLVPHFEKMLYDNALLTRVYLHAWRVTGRSLFRSVVEESLNWLLTEMQDKEGGFYSSLDADSEGVEGKYYTWSSNEIRQLLGDDADLLFLHFGVSQQGNWEGQNILSVIQSADDLAQVSDLEIKEVEEVILRGRSSLRAARADRVKPGLDNKVLTAWNGLMIAALAEAGRDLGNERFTKAAERVAEFIHKHLRHSDGRLLRTWKQGHEAKLGAYLEDYVFLAEGLLALYQSTFEDRWFSWSQELAGIILKHFSDTDGVGFFDTPDDHERLINRPRELQDNAIPSGNAVAASLLLQLSLYTGDGDYWDYAIKSIEAMQLMMARYPLGFAQWLGAALMVLGDPLEIAIAGDPNADDTQALLDALNSRYRPNAIVAVGADNGIVPLLRGRPAIDGLATAYVCRKFVCMLPVNNPAGLLEQLSQASQASS